MTWSKCPPACDVTSRGSASTVMRMAFKESLISAWPRLGAQGRWYKVGRLVFFLKLEFRDAPKMN